MLPSKRQKIDDEFRRWCEEKSFQYSVSNFIAWIEVIRRPGNADKPEIVYLKKRLEEAV